MSEIELFVQGEGIPEITLMRVPADGTVRDVLAAVAAHGRQADDSGGVAEVFVEEAEEPLAPDVALAAAGIGHRGRVHVHRCRRVAVTVNFNQKDANHPFPPSATVRRVKAWAVEKFKLNEVDAAEHVLQRCGSAERPDEDVHIGSLVQTPNCAVCFDLVPKQRVEG